MDAARCVNEAAPCCIHWVSLPVNKGPYNAHCGTLLFLLDLAPGEVAGDFLKHHAGQPEIELPPAIHFQGK